jgi:hypothetical protein
MNRRQFIRNSAFTALSIKPVASSLHNLMPTNDKVEILNPSGRVPVSMINDDSTALVHMAHYGIPQFAEVFPENYLQDWRKLPREIPDSFVMEFIEWCDLNGVKGKYSMVPYPACTGWLHRFIPGWSNQDLKNSLDLVRNDVTKNWDIHPEMISHTRVIDIKTGLPYPDATPQFMENWEWSQEKSADELTSYISYALNVLKEAGFYCDGVTTPGGFCHRNIPNLAAATLEAVKENYNTNISHFFRAVITDKDKSVAPVVVEKKGINTSDPSCSVHIIGCTGDWFGGWDGLTPGDVEKFITKDLSSGRMVEVIERGEPALMVCHWPGIYYNGEKLGFNIFKEVVDRLKQKYGSTIHWMKLSEISQYWAAKEFVSFEESKNGLSINAPFGTKDFTIKIDMKIRNPVLHYGSEQLKLTEISPSKSIEKNSFSRSKGETIACFDLPTGKSVLREI